MKKVAIVGCGAYMDSTYGCPGEWRCLAASRRGEGKFEEPHEVVAFVKCQCPGRAVMPTLAMAMKMADEKPDVVHLSTCLVKPQPGCPYIEPAKLAGMIEKATGLPVVMETHDYH